MISRLKLLGSTALLVGVLLLACVLGPPVSMLVSGPVLPQSSYASVEAAARAASSCGVLQAPGDIEIVSERKGLRGTVVVYKGVCAYPWGRKDHTYGYVTVDGEGTHSGAWSMIQVLPGELAQVSAGNTCVTAADGSEACGDGDALVRVLSPDVRAVEVVYGDGRLDRTEPVAGLSASYGLSDVREVRLLDVTGRVLRSYPMYIPQTTPAP